MQNQSFSVSSPSAQLSASAQPLRAIIDQFRATSPLRQLMEPIHDKNLCSGLSESINALSAIKAGQAVSQLALQKTGQDFGHLSAQLAFTTPFAAAESITWPMRSLLASPAFPGVKELQSATAVLGQVLGKPSDIGFTLGDVMNVRPVKLRKMKLFIPPYQA